MDKLKKIFKHDKSDDATPSRAQGGATPSSTTSAQAPQTNTAASTSQAAPSGVLMTTNYGDITIALYSDKTPKVLPSLGHTSTTNSAT